MPKGDRTGPKGKGPKTGKGQGYCAGNDNPGFTRTKNECYPEGGKGTQGHECGVGCGNHHHHHGHQNSERNVGHGHCCSRKHGQKEP